MENTINQFESTIDFSKVPGIVLVQKTKDLRCGIDKLAAYTQGILHLDPYDGQLYLFTNKSKTRMKAVLYDGIGFWQLVRRPNKSHFDWPVSDDPEDYFNLTSDQFNALLGGFKITPNEYFRYFKPKYA